MLLVVGLILSIVLLLLNSRLLRMFVVILVGLLVGWFGCRWVESWL